jgi:hypothetical protein
MKLFPMSPPPLEDISDFAELFSSRDRVLIGKSIEGMRRQFPQILWKVATIHLRDHEDPGLFSFWLLNVSPAPAEEQPGDRAWTVLLVIFADGQVAVAPGYSAEVWLSGQDWGRLLRVFLTGARRRGYGAGVHGFLKEAARILDKSWIKARTKVKKSRYRDLVPSLSNL